ncbi:MAG: DUF2127 domain-containing protein [Betaproteobacteria bacterium]
MRLTDGLKAVAIYEAAKGVLVLVAGFGVLTLMGQDLQYYAEALVAHLHLNPAKGYPRIFIDAASNVSSGKLWMFAGFALAYAIVRWIEAYGLWRARRWAEWFAVLSGAIYVPAELYGLSHHATPLKVLLLALNVGIVAYMIYVLWRLERGRMNTPDDGAGL